MSEEADLRSCQIRIHSARFGTWRGVGCSRETQQYLARDLTSCRPQPAVGATRQLSLSLDRYPRTEGTVQKLCRRRSKHTSIHLHADRFRHTFAVRMLRADTDLVTLQRLMAQVHIRILTRYLLTRQVRAGSLIGARIGACSYSIVQTC
jgi:site-specific recombinase XerD